MRRLKRRRKKLFKVLSPKILGGKEVGYTISYEPSSIVGRRIEVLLYDLTQLPIHLYIKVKLRIVEVDGDTAKTEFDGFEYFREYIRSLFQRGTSYVDIHRELSIGDVRYRLFIDVFTPKRINTSRKKAIRRLILNYIDSLSYDSEDKFITDLIYGVLDNEVLKLSRKIYPVRWAAVTKVKKLHN